MNVDEAYPMIAIDCIPRPGSNAPSDGRADSAYLQHQIGELIRIQCLSAIADGLIRVRMHLDDQTVGTRGHGGSPSAESDRAGRFHAKGPR